MTNDKRYQRLFALVRCVFADKTPAASLFEGMESKDWQALMDCASEQNVLPICFEAFDKCSVRPDIDNLMEWLGQTCYQEAVYEEQWRAAKKLGDVCHEYQIRCFVMKGFSLSVLYPKANHRASCDLDIYCTNADGSWAGEEMNTLLEREGVGIDRSYYKNSKFTFNNLIVENHRHVLPVKGSKKAKELEKELLGFLVPKVSKFLGDSYLDCPSDTFLALHTLAHAQEHFFEEGINLRHITDWAVLLSQVSSFKSQVSWRSETRETKTRDTRNTSAFWLEWKTVCERYGLLKFGYAMSRLANKVCGVTIPFDCPPASSEDDLLLKDILMAKHSDAKNDSARRVELIGNIFRDSWKFKYFSDTNAVAFVCRRVWGYLFEKE